MKIQAKLLTFLLLVAFIPLLFVAFLTYQSARKTIVFEETSKLELVASIQKQRVKDAITQYLNTTQQITSRLKIRENTALYAQSKDSKIQESINATLIESKKATSEIVSISVLDTSGKVIASTNGELLGQDLAQEPFFTRGQKTIELNETFKDSANILNVRLTGPLILKEELFGVIEVVARADKLIAITEDYTGLGNTGESFIAKADTQRNAVFLTPLRFNSNASLTKTTIGDPANIPMMSAISGRETIYTGHGIVDYRGKEVFAATQFVESLHWGIIAKVDRDEALMPIIALRNFFLIIFISSFMAIVLISFLVSKRITDPIIKLVEFANRLAKADFTTTTTTVKVDSKDEIGVLAGEFNSMALRLKGVYGHLEEQVAEKTKDLSQKVEELEKFNKLIVGRELKMIELKKEISELKKARHR